MSDLVPENPFNGLVRVVKLINGDELVGLVREIQYEKITLVMPAKIESGFTRDQNNNLVQYIKMTNYAANVENFEISLNRMATMFVSNPTKEMIKMYEAFVVAIKSDPQTIISNHSGDMELNPESGLQLLNDLFNNLDFVDFVNNLIESFEGESIFDEIGDDDGEEPSNLLPEDSTIDLEEKEPDKTPKKKKRRRIKPTTTELPFDPEGNPNSAEGWSDNPSDYL